MGWRVAERYRTSRNAADALAQRVRRQIAPAGEGDDDTTLDAALDELRDRAGADAAAESRAARAWHRRADEENATWLGTLLDLAEAGDQVVLNTDRGTTLHGTIDAVGREVIVLRTGPHEQAICAADTVTSVRALQRSATAQGDRKTADVDLRLLLHGFAEERRAVVVQPRGGESVAVVGTLVSCGADVCSVRTDQESAHGSTPHSGPLPMVHVRLGAIAVVTVFVA